MYYYTCVGKPRSTFFLGFAPGAIAALKRNVTAINTHEGRSVFHLVMVLLVNEDDEKALENLDL